MIIYYYYKKIFEYQNIKFFRMFSPILFYSYSPMCLALYILSTSHDFLVGIESFVLKVQVFHDNFTTERCSLTRKMKTKTSSIQEGNLFNLFCFLSLKINFDIMRGCFQIKGVTSPCILQFSQFC